MSGTWEKIEDVKIKHRWVHPGDSPECHGDKEVFVGPEDYADIGTPCCGECGADYLYVDTWILIEKKKKGTKSKVILVDGNLSNGFEFIGPFADRDEATSYDDDQLGGGAWVATLVSPEAKLEQIEEKTIKRIRRGGENGRRPGRIHPGGPEKDQGPLHPADQEGSGDKDQALQ